MTGITKKRNSEQAMSWYDLDKIDFLYLIVFAFSLVQVKSLISLTEKQIVFKPYKRNETLYCAWNTDIRYVVGKFYARLCSICVLSFPEIDVFRNDFDNFCRDRWSPISNKKPQIFLKISFQYLFKIYQLFPSMLKFPNRQMFPVISSLVFGRLSKWLLSWLVLSPSSIFLPCRTLFFLWLLSFQFQHRFRRHLSP